MMNRISSPKITTFYKSFLLSLIFISFISFGKAQNLHLDKTPVSTSSQALNIINDIKDLKQSPFWPNVKPLPFLNNLKQNIIHPLDLYEGSYTNFCGYAALSYLPLHDDPKSYIIFMIDLYRNGIASYNNVKISPHKVIQNVAGTLRFKGKLDIRPADQIWFLSLADHFKGYINILSRNYKPGSENTFWASVNYGKFNRMVKELFNYKVKAKGSDLLHPGIQNLVSYLQNCLKSGTTIVYLNSQFLLKKNDNLKPGIPTHYIVLLNLVSDQDGTLTMTYWDYGFRSLRQLSPSFLKRIVFGVSHCTLKQDSIE